MPRPKTPKSRVLNWTDLWRVIPIPEDNPMKALPFRQGWYHLTYYPEKGKARHKNLWTTDPLEAQQRRDDLYTKARKIGLAATSAMEASALQILREIKAGKVPTRGIIPRVQFAGKSGSFKTMPEAVAFLEGIVRDVLKNRKD